MILCIYVMYVMYVMYVCTNVLYYDVPPKVEGMCIQSYSMHKYHI